MAGIKKTIKEGLEVISFLSIVVTEVSGFVAFNMANPNVAVQVTMGGAALSFVALLLASQIKPRMIGISTHQVREDWSL